MDSPNVLALGFLLLIANLSVGALFSPAWRESRGEDRVPRFVRLCVLGAVEVAAWAVVLYHGGVVTEPFDAFKSSLAWFVQLGWLEAPLSGPLGGLSHFIAINGLLFVPVTLLPLVRRRALPQPEEVVLPASFQNELQAVRKPEPAQEQPAPVPKLPPKLPSQRAAEAALAAKVESTEPSASQLSSVPQEPQFLETPVELNAAQAPTSPDAPVAAASLAAGAGQEFQRGGFRPKIPKAIRPDTELSPEEILAEQMKPVGPTPPPIRFGWKNP